MVNELELFHGCGRTDPLEISNSEEGFDVCHSQRGSWDLLIILQQMLTIQTNMLIVYHMEKEVFNTKVILGEIFDCGEKKKTVHSESHPLKNCNQHP